MVIYKSRNYTNWLDQTKRPNGPFQILMLYFFGSYLCCDLIMCNSQVSPLVFGTYIIPCPCVHNLLYICQFFPIIREKTRVFACKADRIIPTETLKGFLTQTLFHSVCWVRK